MSKFPVAVFFCGRDSEWAGSLPRKLFLVRGKVTACRTAAASQVAARRVLLSVFPAPYAQLFLFCTPDAEFSHFLVIAYFGFREMPVLPENDVET